MLGGGEDKVNIYIGKLFKISDSYLYLYVGWYVWLSIYMDINIYESWFLISDMRRACCFTLHLLNQKAWRISGKT